MISLVKGMFDKDSSMMKWRVRDDPNYGFNNQGGSFIVSLKKRPFGKPRNKMKSQFVVVIALSTKKKILTKDIRKSQKKYTSIGERNLNL